MKLPFSLLGLSFFIFYSCNMNQVSGEQNQFAGNMNISDTIYFTSQVKPIFIKNCSPCHFPGGKMYQRLPFDQDTTIINHETGILKRIKTAEEIKIIKNFIQQNKSGLSSDKPPG